MQEQPGNSVRQRKPGHLRRQEIVAVAAKLFAAKGFAVSTRAISEALGMTQAALYKHFASKQALIEAVFQTGYLQQQPSDFSHILEATQRPLEARLTAAYQAFFAAITETSLKLFQRASYDGMPIAQRYAPHLDERILWPMIEQLRGELGLPPLAQLAARAEEREVVLMLHSCVVFLAIRKYVYRVPFDGREPGLIAGYVRLWLPGARGEFLSLHGR